MKNSVFFNFVSLLLYKHKNRHIAIFIICIFLVFIVSCVLFIKNSLQNELLTNLQKQSDFTVQNIVGGKIEDINLSLMDKIKSIDGVKEVKQRAFGSYYFLSEDRYFTIVGIDIFDDNLELKELLKDLNINSFLQTDSMIIGSGVKKLFDKYHYFDSYDFVLPNNSKKTIKIFKDIPKEADLIANDIVIMDIDVAKKILNIQDGFASNIAVYIPNELEALNIKEKILKLDLNLRVIQKDDIKKMYENIFNYKGGFFLIIFLVVIFTFTLILYQRYSQISSNEKKQIAILKALGYSVKDIIKIKLSENFIIAFLAYMFGVIFAYIYVFIFNAPIIKNIFIGFSNLENDFILQPYMDISSLITLFLFFMIPFLSAVLIPVWKIAAIDSFESLK